jgi:axial budding pattern protein 2
MTLRTVEPDDSPTSEADSLEAFVHSRAKNRNSTNPLFSSQVDRRVSSGLRALERARSQRNRADTVSVSTFSDEYRQSIQERPVSMALSASEYGGEDNRFSQYQSLQPPPNLHPLAEGAEMSRSQLSLAHDYRGVISPLPRFWSDNSLSSARRLASGSHEQAPQPSGGGASAMAQSSSMVSDLEEHLSRKASPQKSKQQDRGMSLEPPPALKNLSSQGLPVAGSGELAFV